MGTSFIGLRNKGISDKDINSPPKGGGFHPSRNYKLNLKKLLTIGIIGAYIGNLFDEMKNRPEYIIEKKRKFR